MAEVSEIDDVQIHAIPQPEQQAAEELLQPLDFAQEIISSTFPNPGSAIAETALLLDKLHNQTTDPLIKQAKESSDLILSLSNLKKELRPFKEKGVQTFPESVVEHFDTLKKQGIDLLSNKKENFSKEDIEDLLELIDKHSSELKTKQNIAIATLNSKTQQYLATMPMARQAVERDSQAKKRMTDNQRV